ncbi:MAG: beta-ketoacyl-ACP synthase III [candidate division WOR-3 bacterium]
MGFEIVGISSYVPETILTNFDLEKIVETSDEWITERTGIKERRIAKDDEVTSDLAAKATLKLFKEINFDPLKIDAIIFATATPDNLIASTACNFQTKIGAKNAFAFDISAACPGFLYGLIIADSFLRNDKINYVLVAGAETLSRYLDWLDRTTCVLFGDGAGIILLKKDNSKNKIIAWDLGSDGSLRDLLIMPAGGVSFPFSLEALEKRMCYIKMKGREVFKNAVLKMQESTEKVIEMAKIKPSEIDWVIPHQANIRIIEALRERLNIPKEKVYVNIEKYGNTSAASIPIALSEMIEKGLLKKGQIILMTSFGAGFTWGTILMEW